MAIRHRQRVNSIMRDQSDIEISSFDGSTISNYYNIAGSVRFGFQIFFDQLDQVEIEFSMIDSHSDRYWTTRDILSDKESPICLDFDPVPFTNVRLKFSNGVNLEAWMSVIEDC